MCFLLLYCVENVSLITVTVTIRFMNKSMQQKVEAAFLGDDDLRVRSVFCGITLTVLCLDTMADGKKVCDYVLMPLADKADARSLTDVETRLSAAATVVAVCSYDDALDKLLNGHTLVLDGNNALAVDTRVETGRSVTEPPTSMVMRGPREGFVENAKVNLTLLRKRLKTTAFKARQVNVGKYTNTAVFVCYLEGVAEPHVADDITQRLQSIVIDGIIDSSYLAKYLDTQSTMLFRRVGMTEKPDVAVGKLLEGRVAVIADGSPMVLTLPYLYIEDLQSPGDYYENSTMTTLNRSLRLLGVLASVLLPSLYVCLQMYNYQIIPLKFLITILNSTEAIPFSPLAEMLLVLVIFDILREANLRMPSAVGISLSLVGAIVLGDAAVKAGLIGAPAVMIGALSGIGLFIMPDNTFVLSLLRLVITTVGGMCGILGVNVCMLVILVYLCSLQMGSSPFLAPYAPDIPLDRQDAVGQKPLQAQRLRPNSIPNVNKTRRG